METLDLCRLQKENRQWVAGRQNLRVDRVAIAVHRNDAAEAAANTVDRRAVRDHVPAAIARDREVITADRDRAAARIIRVAVADREAIRAIEDGTTDVEVSEVDILTIEERITNRDSKHQGITVREVEVAIIIIIGIPGTRIEIIEAEDDRILTRIEVIDDSREVDTDRGEDIETIGIGIEGTRGVGRVTVIAAGRTAVAVLILPHLRRNGINPLRRQIERRSINIPTEMRQFGTKDHYLKAKTGTITLAQILIN